MNITKENKDELNAVIKLQITPEDYNPKVDKTLKDYRKSAQIKGFRQGKAPMGLIKKMVGTSITVQEIDKLVSESLTKYITDEKLNILGQPIPSDEQKQLDLNKEGETFEFLFDIGMAPEIDITVDKRTKIPYYKIKVEDDIINKEVDRYKNQFATPAEYDKVEDGTYLKGVVEQIDDAGNLIEDGIKKDDTMIALDIMKDEEIKKSFIGVEKDKTIDFDVKKAYPNNTEIAGILGIDKDAVDATSPNFRFTVKNITKYIPAEVNQELYDKVFGKDTVKSEDEFRAKIAETISEVYKDESEYRFGVDTKAKLLGKLKMSLPDEFLKRWIKISNQEKPLTDEQIEKEYPKFIEDVKWQLVTKKMSDDLKFDVTVDDLKDESRKFTEMQFKQYGMPLSSLSEEHLNQFIEKNLEDQKSVERFAENAIQNKVIAYVKETAKVDHTEITIDELKELYDK